MILVVVSNAALIKGIPFILLPPPKNKSDRPLKLGALCQNSPVVLVSWHKALTEYLVLMKILSRSCCCFIPVLSQTKDQTVSFCFTAVSLFCLSPLRPEVSSLPEHQKSVLHKLLSAAHV